MVVSNQNHSYTRPLWVQKFPFIPITDSDLFLRRQVDRWAVAGGISCFHTVQHSWKTSVIRLCANAKEQCVQCDRLWPDWFLPSPVHQGMSTHYWQLKEQRVCILQLTSHLFTETRRRPVNLSVHKPRPNRINTDLEWFHDRS